MKLLLSAAVLLVLAGISLAKDDSASGNKMLLGADDVDKKQAEMSESTTEPPKDVKEVKKLVKNDKRQLKELQERARALKEQLRNSKQLSKSEKRELKREFRTAKHDLHAKKMELSTLKAEMKTLKGEKHRGGPAILPTRVPPQGKKNGRSKNRDGGRRKKNKLELIGAEEPKINNPEDFGLQSEPAAEDIQLSKKEQRKLHRKMSRKASRKNKKGRKNGDISDRMVTEERPSLRSSDILDKIPKRARIGKSHRGRRIPCSTDADCHNGAMCFENRKGHKFCKGNGMDKTAGKKCHRSEQCARGLKCFVRTPKPGARIHKKPKGICADPATADLNKGSFLPFATASK